MNKHAYRVIFNRKRRQMMAVAETVSGRGSTADSPARNAAGVKTATQLISFMPSMKLMHLGVAIAALFGAVAVVQAQIVADPNAGGQRPVIDQSANGLPVVQIVTPDAGGMSHNKYQQFNVDPGGAILNNATAAIQTQQGGFIGGNPNLVPGNAARIILNEVTGTDRSQLNGYIEVAGQRAEVIIANPNGISCAGCGFINTTRGVLTTGAPVFGGNGSLEAFRITRGDIAINALNGGNIEQLDLIARSVQVNGDIWADRLNAITGANQVRYADLGVQIIAGDGAKPTVGIDIAQLGGMYANKIRLVGTEAGVGVASLGNIAAQAGDLQIDSRGKITLKGKTSASGSLAIHGGDEVSNSGTLYSEQALAIDSTGRIANSGTLSALGDVALSGAGTLDNDGGVVNSKSKLAIQAATLSGEGKIMAGTDATISLQGDYTNSAGNLIAASGDLNFTTTGKLTNFGGLEAAQALHLNVDGLDNRDAGLINAADTIIHASGDITNTARIYGDRIAIAAATLANTTDTANGRAGVIASRGDLDIGAVDTFNLEGAQLYSAGNMAIGRALDGNDRATGTADQIQNQSARIESEGGMQLAASNIVNQNNHFQTEQRNVSVADVVEYQLDGSPQRWDASQVRQGHCEPNSFDCLFMPDGSSGQNYTIYRYKRHVSQTFITESRPGEIVAGGDLAVTGNIVNDNSRITVGGALSGALDSLTNNQAPGVAITTDAGTAQHTSTVWRGGIRRKRERVWDDQVAYRPAAVRRDSPMQIAPDAAVSPDTGSGVPTPVPGADGVLPGLVLPDSALFIYHPESGLGYLIETDPAFTNYKNYLSSDYMLSRMAMDPALMQKRLGDGYYEQKLINDQIAELTGKRFLGAYTGNETQYQALMDAGIASAGSLQLKPGVALTAAQKAALTQDIVWLVSKDIAMPDGSISKVLAPVVYLAGGKAAAQPGSASISAKNIDLSISHGLDNGGTLHANDNLLIQANDIANTGIIASDKTSGNTVLTAANDLVNNGGKINGNRVGLLAGNDLVMSTTTTSGAAATGDANHGSRSSHTLIDRVAGIEAGQLDMRAGRDINLDAAQIAVSGDAVIAAGRDLKLNAVTTETSLDLNADANNHLRQSQTQAEGTQIQADGAIAMTAGRDINATAAYVNAGQALTVAADRDIRLDSAQQGNTYDQEIRTTSSGLLASSTKHIKDQKQSSQAVGTTFSGDSVQIAATRDISVTGGNIVGTHDVSLAAGNNIRIATSENTADQSYYKEETTDGLFGTDGGIGVTMGSKAHQNTQTTQQTSHNSSMVGSTEGNVQIVAGNNYTQSGSNVAALAGDIGIAAKSVDIEAVQNIVVQTTKDHTEQSGLTLGVSAPILSAIQAMQQMKSASGKTDDPRMKALAAATAASSAQSAATASQNPADGATISLTIGASKSDSQSRQVTSTAAGSSIKAGGNVVIAAVGDGKNSHLNVIGSDVEAGKNATLKADGDINLRAAQSSSDQHSKNSSSSAAVGIAATYGEKGFAFGVTANAAGSRGKADGSDVANNNTHITAGNSLTLESGHDTTLAGAVASAKEVIANVGTSGQGDLTIQSLQDTSSYKSKDQHIGGSVTIGYGASGSFSAGQSKVNGDYASVGEQSGIKAGDGGFNVHVNGNTDLAGGVIASAATEGKNLLVTETLTQSDIENHSRYEASSISIGGGYGEQSKTGGRVQTFTGGATGTAGGYSSTEGNANGTSRSGVSAGTVVITDDQAQQQLTGQTAAATVDSINRDVGDGTASAGSLVKDWDAQQLKDKVNAESQITASFGSAAARQIGDYATKKYNAAMASGDKEEAAKWAEGGEYRVAMHTAVGALTGNVEGAAGAFASATSMKAIGDAINEMDLPKGIKQGLAQVVATAVGAAVGGGVGAMAAVNVEANNRQLHPDEIEWIGDHKKDFSKKLADKLEREVTDEEAMVWLSMAGEGNVDNVYATDHGNRLGLQTSEERWAYNIAKQYISENAKGNFVDSRGIEQKIFVAKGNDFNNSSTYMEYRNNEAYRDFYWNLRRDNLKPDNPTPQELATYNARQKIRWKSEGEQLIIDGVPAAVGGMTGKALNRGGKAAGKGAAGAGKEDASTPSTKGQKKSDRLPSTPLQDGKIINEDIASIHINETTAKGTSVLSAVEIRAIVRESGTSYGKSGQAFNVKSEKELNSLFNKITAGSENVSVKYDGTMRVLPDGTKIGLRNTSNTGGQTIDIFPKHGKSYRVHIEPN
ncbi:filamentous hemagglutinin N-terminal domain-containing protein [Oxalobacteraceae bacterium CAVE-383]|nr:filamentous hemagglutinin N-terminal domain-containing protein [Oxalobacteraceae bacterium CAVE-383]